MAAEPANKGVICHDWAPKSKSASHSVSRAFCLMQPTSSCPSCSHSQFTVKFQTGIGKQEVACPRWERASGRTSGEKPSEYVTVQRQTCLQMKPLDYCPSCPNSDAANLPESEPGWYERMKK